MLVLLLCTNVITLFFVVLFNRFIRKENTYDNLAALAACSRQARTSWRHVYENKSRSMEKRKESLSTVNKEQNDLRSVKNSVNE